ncbi:hypothetical protein G7Y89_g4802 [Cudoniella acicularis]|uniref:Heterokaryon incompatibility domain-containing protein n=1 Tax=Cudoniella acicularis TaxID=354080 RepID=A0A8H4RQ12_9HELO|nr:hypothetical protein G7Y89_g4802 [Cudoniella acicularis]
MAFDPEAAAPQARLLDNPVSYLDGASIRACTERLYVEMFQGRGSVTFKELLKGAYLARNYGYHFLPDREDGEDEEDEENLSLSEQDNFLSLKEWRSLEIQYSNAFWKEPKDLLVTLVGCWMASFTQGWVQVANGNLGWPRDFQVDINKSGTGKDVWTFGLVNAVPWFSAAFLGTILINRICESKRFSRRGVVFIAALFTMAAMIAGSRTTTWQGYLVTRIILGIGIGAQASIVLTWQLEVLPPAKRGVPGGLLPRANMHSKHLSDFVKNDFWLQKSYVTSTFRFSILAFFATIFFSTSNLRHGNSGTESLGLSIGFGAANAVFSTISYFLIEKAPEFEEEYFQEGVEGKSRTFWGRLRGGRRTLLLSSLLGGAIILPVIALLFKLPQDNPAKLPVITVCILLFTLTYSPGAGTIPFVYSLEIWPEGFRDIGMSWARVELFWGFCLVWAFMPDIDNAISLEEMDSVFRAGPFYGPLVEIFKIFIYKTPPFRYLWQRWTTQPWRFGWQSLNELPRGGEKPQSDDDLRFSRRTTSRLCGDCLGVVGQSGLLAGSMGIFVRREEWHDWRVSLRGLNLDSSREFCHLCNILWLSVPEAVRADLVHHGGQICQTVQLELRLRLWEDSNDPLWYDNRCRYMELYSGENKLCNKFKISKESLQEESPTINLPLWTGSDECISLAKDWIQGCVQGHSSHCGPGPGPSQSFVPTRLVYVGESDANIRLYTHTDGASDVSYLALSHCWGTGINTKLTLHNIDAWHELIDYDLLPRNFQDAISFTRRIGVGYVWIDSLCIIQGCNEDWEREAAKMSKVYAHAFCTISACGSANAHGGCFQLRNPLLQFTCNLLFSRREALAVRTDNIPNPFVSEVDYSPLSRRAWPFQERLLSRRIVHFTAKSLFFECSTHSASEVLRAGTKYLVDSQSKSKWPSRLGTLAGARRVIRKSSLYSSDCVVASQDDSVAGYRAAFNTLRCNDYTTTTPIEPNRRLELHRCWFKLVRKYTSAGMTVATDRLVAISGIARSIQGESGGPLYLAGLWKDHLPLDLLWSRKNSPSQRPTDRCVPSWSWGAVDGEVCEQVLVADEEECHVIDLAKECDVHVEDSGHLSIKGYVDLRCPVVSVEMAPRTGENEPSLTILGHESGSVMDFSPDISPLAPASDLLYAELARVAIYKWDLGIWLLSSHGIVVRRIDAAPEPPFISYERVGSLRADFQMMNAPESLKRLQGDEFSATWRVLPNPFKLPIPERIRLV